jgi:hypothetical protein
VPPHPPTPGAFCSTRFAPNSGGDEGSGGGDGGGAGGGGEAGGGWNACPATVSKPNTSTVERTARRGRRALGAFAVQLARAADGRSRRRGLGFAAMGSRTCWAGDDATCAQARTDVHLRAGGWAWLTRWWAGPPPSSRSTSAPSHPSLAATTPAGGHVAAAGAFRAYATCSPHSETYAWYRNIC